MIRGSTITCSYLLSFREMVRTYTVKLQGRYTINRRHIISAITFDCDGLFDNLKVI